MASWYVPISEAVRQTASFFSGLQLQFGLPRATVLSEVRKRFPSLSRAEAVRAIDSYQAGAVAGTKMLSVNYGSTLSAKNIPTLAGLGSAYQYEVTVCVTSGRKDEQAFRTVVIQSNDLITRGALNSLAQAKAFEYFNPLIYDNPEFSSDTLGACGFEYNSIFKR
jgi:hypothetical protein